MSSSKRLSNPFSTGGGGPHFEAHVQACFVALMLTRGHAPCLPCWPISEIKLQGKIDGFDTDDLIVFVEDVNTKERRKLLGQVKHSIAITQGSTVFGEVIQAAWNDFRNPKVFTKSKDVIALITGPLTATDAHNVTWLLNQARHTKEFDEFLRNVNETHFSPPKSAEKLGVFKHHLKAANGGNALSDGELYDFLNHFHLLGYDLGSEFGVVLSLLHSHITQYEEDRPHWVWSRVVDIVQGWNQDAGTVTRDNLPEDLLEAFKQKRVTSIPVQFQTPNPQSKTDWNQHPDATYLALVVLLGSWKDNNESDRIAVSQLLGITYGEWLKKAQEILPLPDSPLALRNGVWSVVEKVEVWNQLGLRILDQNLETFASLAQSVLSEADPAFELPVADRYAANLYGKVPSYSHALRNGISEGVAILGSFSEPCVNCSAGKARLTSVLTIRNLLADADWILWGSLSGLLPNLAEAAPDEFLTSVENTLHRTPCPFDELFAQEGTGVTARNYLSGLLWALEGLAWEEDYLVRVSVILGDLASHDPGGKWSNRPSNSLATILLPWMPRTLASFEKRKVAIQTLINESPEEGWGLVVQLLPGQRQTSSGTHKPRWRKVVPNDWKKGVTQEEYWKQVDFYAELAVEMAGHNIARLTTLVDRFDKLPKLAFDQLLVVLSSSPILDLPEEERLTIWGSLTKFTIRHRRYSSAKWALSEDLIEQIERVAQQLAPTDPFYLYQHLFSGQDFYLYEHDSHWQEQKKEFDTRREIAVKEVFQHHGLAEVIRFAEAVSKPEQVGYALAVVNDSSIEHGVLPQFLVSSEPKHKTLVKGFVQRRFGLDGWNWCDGLERSVWTTEELGQFLAYLPFLRETWNRAEAWLADQEHEYWTRAEAHGSHDDDDLFLAVEKLLEYGRPRAALNCLHMARYNQKEIDNLQCIRALFAAVSANEPSYKMDTYQIVELIKFLQEDPAVDPDELFRLEWVYLPLLDGHSGAIPRTLERRLAKDPDFFCELIQLLYRSRKEDHPSKAASAEMEALASNAWRLLYEWRIPPGTEEDGNFSTERFAKWLQHVKDVCEESGHLEVALIEIGKVLSYAPPDPDGLWIHRSVAAALNDRSAEDMRHGYHNATCNSRGVYYVDNTGNAEKELAGKYRDKAEKVENAGFQRLAVTLRQVANGYEREAEEVLLGREH